MAKDPAFLFYSSDFLTGTMTMTDEQVGRYIRLLCLQHQKGILTEKDMMFICKSKDDDIFGKFLKNASGYFNQRLREEAEKRAAYSNSRALNRVKDKKKFKKDMKKTLNSYVPHMENENVNEDEDINNNINGSAFLKFWQIYPKKKSKGQAEKAFSKINPDEQLLAVMIAAIERAKKSEDWIKEKGKYIPHPATWLNAKGWEDEETEAHPLAGKVSEKTLGTVRMLENWRPPHAERS